MPINFFIEACKTSSSSKKFGICDNPAPAKDPAYINEIDTNKWIAGVENESGKLADFFPIDHCVEVLKPNGDMESRCDGMLRFNNNIVFIELKDRTSSGWVRKGREQLTITLSNFIANHPSHGYAINECYVCNKQFPLAVKSINTEMQKFKDDTATILRNKGILLKADRNIVL